MAHEHNPSCEELQTALGDARGMQIPPLRQSGTLVGDQLAVLTGPEDLTPQASPELEHDIRNLEESLRTMGCEPR